MEGFGELQLGDVTSVDTRTEYCIFDLAQKIFFLSVGHCGAFALSSGNIPELPWHFMLARYVISNALFP